MTMHFGPDEVLLALDAQFHPGTPLQEIQVAINRIEQRIVGPLSGGQPDPHRSRSSRRGSGDGTRSARRVIDAGTARLALQRRRARRRERRLLISSAAFGEDY
jgi:hypothetical protein